MHTQEEHVSEEEVEEGLCSSSENRDRNLSRVPTLSIHSANLQQQFLCLQYVSS